MCYILLICHQSDSSNLSKYPTIMWFIAYLYVCVYVVIGTLRNHCTFDVFDVFAIKPGQIHHFREPFPR